MACAAKFTTLDGEQLCFCLMYWPWCSINSLLQGRCKSCYAFAVTGALESMKALESRKLKVLGSEETKLTSLSEQNIIDCSGDWSVSMQLYVAYLRLEIAVPYGNRGCGGGSRESSIMYAIDFGVDTDSSYPYVARVHIMIIVLYYQK